MNCGKESFELSLDCTIFRPCHLIMLDAATSKYRE